MTMTHSDEVNQHLSETWPSGHEWWGHDNDNETLKNGPATPVRKMALWT